MKIQNTDTSLSSFILDTTSEKPPQAYKISDAVKPNANALNCQYNAGKSFPNTNIARPDLGSIEGNIEPSNIRYTIKGIAASVGGIENPKLEYVCAAWQHFLL